MDCPDFNEESFACVCSHIRAYPPEDCSLMKSDWLVGAENMAPPFQWQSALWWMDRATERTQGRKAFPPHVPRFFLLKIILSRHTWHTKLEHIYMCTIWCFNICTHDQDNEHIHCPLHQGSLVPLVITPSHPSSPYPIPRQPSTCFLSLKVNLHFLEFYII